MTLTTIVNVSAKVQHMAKNVHVPVKLTTQFEKLWREADTWLTLMAKSKWYWQVILSFI
jgi:hypothetical protein